MHLSIWSSCLVRDNRKGDSLLSWSQCPGVRRVETRRYGTHGNSAAGYATNSTPPFPSLAHFLFLSFLPYGYVDTCITGFSGWFSAWTFALPPRIHPFTLPYTVSLIFLPPSPLHIVLSLLSCLFFALCYLFCPVWMRLLEGRSPAKTARINIPEGEPWPGGGEPRGQPPIPHTKRQRIC